MTFAVMMFQRRHLYEHKGGEVDEEYLAKSSDNSVRLKQIIRETRDNAQRLANLVAKLARNLHDGFHELFPPEAAPVELKQRMDKMRQQAERARGGGR